MPHHSVAEYYRGRFCSGRRAISLRTPRFDFVAPDNGVLSGVIEPFLKERQHPEQRQISFPAELEAVSLTRREFWRLPVSPTFHGRDIFAPVAAHLSLGTSLEKFGEFTGSITAQPAQRPYQESTGTLVGRIVHIDHFGNLITNFKSEDLPEKPFTVEAGQSFIPEVSRTYGEGEGLLAYIHVFTVSARENT